MIIYITKEFTFTESENAQLSDKVGEVRVVSFDLFVPSHLLLFCSKMKVLSK